MGDSTLVMEPAHIANNAAFVDKLDEVKDSSCSTCTDTSSNTAAAKSDTLLLDGSLEHSAQLPSAEKLDSYLVDSKPLKSNAVPNELPWLSPKSIKVNPTTTSNAEWNKRELELAHRERVLRQRDSTVAQQKNFPAFRPICRHDIATDIPEDGKSLVNNSFSLWKFLFGALLLNVASEITLSFAFLSSNVGIALAGMNFFLLPVCVFFLCHLTLYQAVRRNSSLYFVGFFFAQSITIALAVCMLIGVIEGDGGGIRSVVDAFGDRSILAASVCLASTLFMAGLVMGYLWVFKSAYSYYKVNGGSFNAARTEFRQKSNSPAETDISRRSNPVERHHQV